jgi:hypothetical protein
MFLEKIRKILVIILLVLFYQNCSNTIAEEKYRINLNVGQSAQGSSVGTLSVKGVSYTFSQTSTLPEAQSTQRVTSEIFCTKSLNSAQNLVQISMKNKNDSNQDLNGFDLQIYNFTSNKSNYLINSTNTNNQISVIQDARTYSTNFNVSGKPATQCNVSLSDANNKLKGSFDCQNLYLPTSSEPISATGSFECSI